CSGAALRVFLGQGPDGLSAPTSYDTGPSSSALVVADLNGDGHPDLALADRSSNDVSIYLGAGDGTFASGMRFEIGAGPVALAVGDLNTDGVPDLASANGTPDYSDPENIHFTASVLLGNGDGTFGAPARYLAGWYPQAVAIM